MNPFVAKNIKENAIFLSILLNWDHTKTNGSSKGHLAPFLELSLTHKGEPHSQGHRHVQGHKKEKGNDGGGEGELHGQKSLE